MMSMDEVNRISGEVVDSALRVHSRLGVGLLESAYEACLATELRRRGQSVRTQVEVPLVYDDIKLDVAYRADLIVSDAVLVELKALPKLQPVHSSQLLTYLRLSGLRVALLFNFHEPRLKNGIKRFVNGA